MCCWTHQDPSYPGPVASTTVDNRCRCPCRPGECRRAATGEDIRCDVCAGRIPAPDPTEEEQRQRAADQWAAERRAEMDRWAVENPVVIEPGWLEGVRLWPPPEKPGPAS